MKYIKEFKTIEKILENLIKTKSKYTFTEEFKYSEARKLFENPNIISSNNLKVCYPFNKIKWKYPDFNAMKQFMCDEKGFGISKINKARLTLEV